MAVKKEMVLYYTPEKSAEDQKMKGVLVRLGIRIRNISPEQANQKVGYLAGVPGFEESKETEEQLPVIPERMLVLCGFGERRLSEMLLQFRRAKVPPVPIKAVLTEKNCSWTLYKLYQELRMEHEAMSSGNSAEHTEDGTE